MPSKRPASRSAEQHAASSIAQPVTNSAGRLPDSLESEINETPALSRSYKFHAYNVRWNYADKKRSPEWLCREVSRLRWHHRFHVTGISEVFEIDYSNKLLLDFRKYIISVVVLRGWF